MKQSGISFQCRLLREREICDWFEVSHGWNPPINNERTDSIMWSICPNGIFSIKSLKMHLYNSSAIDNTVNVGALWTSTLPKKCKVFIGTIMHRCLNTADKIQARHPFMSLCLNWCVLCRQNIEDLEHLFFHYPYAVSIWHYLQRGGLNLSTFVSFFHITQKLIHTPPTSSKDIISSSLIRATLWCLWLGRNGRIFQAIDRCADRIVDDILYLAASWCSKSPFFCNYDIATITLN